MKPSKNFTTKKNIPCINPDGPFICIIFYSWWELLYVIFIMSSFENKKDLATTAFCTNTKIIVEIISKVSGSPFLNMNNNNNTNGDYNIEKWPPSIFFTIQYSFNV